MSSDPQNRPDSNVVALHRAEFVASIEKKLADARRFFSLHDYASCAELVQEVLAADPQNSKAKALLDLSSIKLSKRKLYQKIADPQPQSSLTGSPELRKTAEAPHLSAGPEPKLEPTSALPGPPPATLLSSSTIIEEPPRQGRRGGLPESPPVPQDSMRERTISALVDLLQNKGATLQDWKDDRQSRTAKPTPTLPLSSSETVAPIALPSEPVPSGKPRPPVLSANRDFLPGSLNDLFDPDPEEPTPLPRVEPQPPAAPASVAPQKEVPAPVALSSPPGRGVPNPNSIRLEEPTSLPPVEPQPPAVPVSVAPQQEAPAPVALSSPPDRGVPNPHSIVLVPPAESHGQPKADVQVPASVPLPPTTTEELPKRRPDSPAGAPLMPASAPPNIVPPLDIRIFDQITPPRPVGYQEEVERKTEQRSEETKNSEMQSVAIAQIKKYLYQEEYDLCARDLAKVRELFPKSPEIQTFVENTSKRLVELQRIKKFEVQAKDLMASAVAFYQEGKREEALIAVREILRVNPNHVQAREFVSFVERHQGKNKTKQPTIQKVRSCRSCGSEVDAVSQFCYRCGKRL